ncbi:MAG: substrate-binding domain-containing protein, partial [Rhodospirillales bacterium]|nr:substrate-binding domain-containing protein [Rhodospirillales bacterium]
EGLNSLGFSLTGRNFPVLTGSHLVHWELVKQGLGVGVMPIRTGDAEPLVRRILPTMDPIEVPVWLVAHRELRTSRRVRLVFDFLFDELSTSAPLSSP